MKEILTKLKEKSVIINNLGENIPIEYILFEEKAAEDISENIIYGIEARKIDSKQLTLESEKINGITSDINFAEYIFNKLVENMAMPCCLCDVIDDLISEKEFSDTLINNSLYNL